jgi:D-alanyl-D-alanine carboxypeptidase (penicillin-binding protein 5/6)
MNMTSMNRTGKNSMRQLIFLGLLFAGTSLAQVPPPPAKTAMPTPAPPMLSANSYVLMDFNSGEILVENQPDLRVEPASITKIMTSYVVFAELAQGKIQLSDTVSISENAWRTGGSRMFIDPSMEVTVEDLIQGMVIQSGNDASVALAEHIGGTEEAFASLMNHYATQLGMTNSNFINSTGLPGENHHVTARDIALLSMALIRDFPDYYRWYSVKEFSFNDIRQHNRNRLLWRDPAVDGLKTGHTEAAGYCLASSALRDGMRLISVVMGSFDDTTRTSESQSLLNYGFRFFETVQLYQPGQELAKGRVWRGEAEQVALGIGEQLFVTIPRGRYDDLKAGIDLQPELSAPLENGAVVGRITVDLEGDRIATRNLITLEAVTEAGFFGRNWDSLKLWAGGWFDDDEEDSED